MTASSPALDEQELHQTKNRIVSVDMARILTALVVMTGHLYLPAYADGGEICYDLANALHNTFGSPSCIFLFLAGYFACRKVTWRKALNNAWWSFAPFLLWNGVFIALEAARGALPEGATWYTLFGVKEFIVPQWDLELFGAPATGRGCLPLNQPLWFMRDLTLLFLLSPLLARCAKLLFPALLLASLVPSLAPFFEHGSILCVMSPYALTFFTAGCAMRGLRQGAQDAILRFYSPWVIALVAYLEWGPWIVGPGVEAGWLSAFTPVIPEPPYLFGNLIRVWALYQVALWITQKIPLAAAFALKFAPVTFLTFAAHMILYRLLPLNGTAWVLVYPPLVFALMALFFFALKRWCRPLLHLVAHYKLRPDDLNSTRPRA